MLPSTSRFLARLCCVWLVLSGAAHAVILFGLDNSANQTDPGTGVPFDSVARVFNGSSIGGSAVYLGDRWMLTANHVGPYNSVSFNGITSYSWDGAPPIQIGTTDMKLFRLTTEPTVAAVPLYSGSSELSAPATLVGWGVGRDPSVPVNTNAVQWGGNSTSAKRWGLNEPRGFMGLAYDSYTYQALYTVLGSATGSPAGLGANEAATTFLDSGSGLFQEFGGVWYLTGITTTLDTLNSSNFGNDQISLPRGDRNFFARISAYESEISAIIIPEPTATVFITGALLFYSMRRQRH